MKQIIRLFILIAALVLGTDHAWANAESNPRVKFVYVDEQHGSAFADEADANRQVTITVTPEDDWRCINGDLTAEVTSNSNMAEAPRRSPGVGQPVAVTCTATNEFTLTLPEDESMNVTAYVSFRAKAPLTVTANDHTINYGEAPANNGVTYFGFEGADEASVLSGTLSFGYTYNQFDPVDTYSITPYGLTSDNYAITFVPGTLTVNPKSITIASVNVENKEYDGTTAATLSGTFSFNDGMIVGSDDVSISFNGASAVFENPNVGSREVTVTGLALSGEKKDNYELTNPDFTTTGSITKKNLTVTANDWTIDYGEEPANDDVEYDGFVNGEDERALSGTLGFDYTYSKYGPVGTYQIMPNGLTSDNYNIIFQPGTLTVKQVATISVDWDDNNNVGGLRPGSLEFRLLANGSETERTVTLNEGNNWRETLNGLTPYDGETLIDYTWSLETSELVNNNYDSDVSQNTGTTGATATFTFTRKTGSLTVKNTVVSDLTTDADKAFTFTVTLDDTSINGKYGGDNDGITFTSGVAIVTLKAGESATATNLLYGTTYTVTQTEVEGFTTSPDFTATGTISASSTEAPFTNTRETGSLTVTNTVYPSDNGTDFVFTVTLSDTTIDGNYGEMTFNNGVATFALTGQTSNNSNSRTATGLPTTVEYTVTQMVNNDFSTTKTGDEGTISTTASEAAFKNIKLTVANFDIDWHDGGNTSSRPELTTTLLSKIDGDESQQVQTITLNEENNWQATIRNLPMYNEDGTEIAYSWREIESVPSGYLLTDHSTGIDASYTYTLKTSAMVKIEWDDADDQDGIRPETLTATLKDDSEYSNTVTLNSTNNWTATVEDLPKYKVDNNEITYTWRQDGTPEGYASTDPSIDGIVTTITNSHTPEVTEVKVSKVWDDDDNEEGFRTESVTVHLMKGEDVIQTAVLNANSDPDHNWTHTWSGLAKNDNGTAINYTVTEDEVEHYTTQITKADGSFTYTVRNSRTVEKTLVSVEAIWDDENNVESFRPTSVTVHLMKGETDLGSVELNANNSWEYTWSDLQKYENGTAINYTVTEDPVANYTTQITKDDGSFTYTVTNTAINVSGNCGQTGDDGSDVTWHYGVTTKALTISGTGQMMDYSSDQGSDNQYHSTAPWSHFDSEIETVVVVEGVTYIGNDAFAYCPALTSVSLPSTLEAIGNNAFTGCTSHTTVTLNGGVTIGNNAFPANATVTIADGLRLYNGMKVLSGAVTDMDDVNGKDLRPAVKITLPTGVTATGTNVFDQNDETYALPGATVTLGYTGPEGSIAVYTVTKDGSDPAETVDIAEEAGIYTFTMPTGDVTVTVLTNIVTKDNFYSFFDDSGTLQDNVPFDELIFQGEFSNLVSYITLDRHITITGDIDPVTGDNAVLNDMGFIIEGNDVTLDNLTLVANSNLGNLIDIAGKNAVISNMNITYDGGDEGAVAINVAGDNVNIFNNTISFESHVTDDSEFAVGLKLTRCNDALVDGNKITTQLPCVYVDNYDEDYYIMGSDKVNPVRLKDCEGLVFKNNTINSTTNDYSADFPTIQAIQIIGCHNSVLDHNNISMIDEMTPAGMDIYLYGINFGYNDNVTFSNNNFNISTKGGKDAAGTAYAFQGVESEVKIIGNSITSISNGPNIGIYVTSMYGGDSDIIIKDNFIKVTGSASSSGSWALVSGIEIQNGDAKIYNNTVYTYNVNAYDEDAYMYGISYAQWMYGDRSFDIQDNTVYTDGKYAISVIDATSLNVVNNTLCAHELYGDDAVDIKSGDNNTVENNLLGYVMPKTGESTYNIPADVSLFKVYDDGGQGWRYSAGCNGTLTLTAPEGYLLQLSGKITTEKDNDYLTVYDGSSNQAGVLIGQVSSSVSSTETAIPTVISTGNVMTLNFYSDNSSNDNSEFDGLNLTVTLIYNLNETDGITDAIATKIADKPAQFKRTGITANAYSTVCLPFDFTAPTGCTIYGFQGIHYDENALAGQGAWVADIAETTTMNAHTPYIFKSTGTEVTFSGTASDAADYSSALESNAVSATVGTDQAWTFKGTYSAIDWSSADPTEPTYGFSTYVPDATIAAGTFVRFVKGASLAPFRARLIYSGSDTHLNAPKRGAANDLPQYIIVRIVESDGSTTAIGTLNTRTGEISTDDWFDLNGRRLSGKPTQKGLYIVNGNKVVIK